MEAMPLKINGSGQFLHNFLVFGRLLRRLGLDINPGRMIDLVQALDAAQRSYSLGMADGAPEYIGAAYRALGMVSKQLGRPISKGDLGTDGSASASADDFFRESLRVLEEGQLDGERARTLREWARYELKDGHRERGVELWKEAREIFWRLGAEMEVERMAELPS
jgi:hypothetical protein